jgi:DnaJ family protein A protein 2
MEKEKILEVSIEKGTPNEHVVTLNGEGDELPDCLAGDVHFFINIQKHAVFTRVGADLFIRKKISLLDALTGFEFNIKHLDGASHHISLIKNEVVGDQENKIVKNLGMPFFKDPLNHGNLIIQIEVVMPPKGSITKEKIEALEKVIVL